MRGSSTDNFSTTDRRNGSVSEANSLLQNILAVSPNGSRFCPHPTMLRTRNRFQMNTLGKMTKKIFDGTYLNDSALTVKHRKL